MWAIVLLPMIWSVLRVGIGQDSGYYLCMAERIADGYIPYRDLRLLYPPLWFYIEAFYKFVFHIPNGVYWPYLILLYAFQISNAYLLYRLVSLTNVKKHYAILAAWCYLLMSHWLDGNDVLIEIPSITFCLLSSVLIFKYKERNYWHFLWIGSISACSFLVKQYGLGTIVLCLYIMIFLSKCNKQQIFTYILGYILPIAICLLIWGNLFLNNVILNGYGTQTAIEAGLELSIASKLSSIFGNLNYFCYMVCPIVYVGWIYVVKAYKQNRLPYLIFIYCGILGFSLIFYFTGWQLHYYQYLLPFSILLMVELMHLTEKSKWKYFIFIMVGWIIMVSFYKTYNNRVYKQYIKGIQKERQEQLSQDIMQYVRTDETIYIVHGSLTPIYFLTNTLPPNLATIGYDCAPLTLNENRAMQQIQSADWVLRYSKDYPYECFFTDSLKLYVEKYPAICLQDSAILLHRMH